MSLNGQRGIAVQPQFMPPYMSGGWQFQLPQQQPAQMSPQYGQVGGAFQPQPQAAMPQAKPAPFPTTQQQPFQPRTPFQRSAVQLPSFQPSQQLQRLAQSGNPQAIAALRQQHMQQQRMDRIQQAAQAPGAFLHRDNQGRIVVGHADQTFGVPGLLT